MVRADMFDMVAGALERFGPEPGTPFGGVQIVLVGDLYQLPPVISGGEEAYFSTVYETPYFFSARKFERDDFPTVSLDDGVPPARRRSNDGDPQRDSRRRTARSCAGTAQRPRRCGLRATRRRVLADAGADQPAGDRAQSPAARTATWRRDGAPGKGIGRPVAVRQAGRGDTAVQGRRTGDDAQQRPGRPVGQRHHRPGRRRGLRPLRRRRRGGILRTDHAPRSRHSRGRPRGRWSTAVRCAAR